MEDFGHETFFEETSWFVFDNNFNKKLNDYILNVLQNYNFVKFGDKFNRNIDFLPNNIIHLKIGEDYYGIKENRPIFLCKCGWITIFNQKINKFPSSLKYLELGYEFNQKLDNLPTTLEVLELGHKFNQPLDFLPDAKNRKNRNCNFCIFLKG